MEEEKKGKVTYYQEQKSLRATIRDLDVDETLVFNVEYWPSVRNYASTLNSIFYQQGKRWRTSVCREEGTASATRIS